MRLLPPQWSSSLRALALVALLVAPPVSAQMGSITGKVTDANTNNPVPGARVSVVSSNLTAITNALGVYTLKSVAPGTVELRVMSVGYGSLTRTVTVAPGKPTTADWTIKPVPFAIDEITVTAVGEQHRRELGNAVARVDGAQLAAEAPVTNLTDMLNGGRVAGVTVLQNDGTPGAGSRIRIRGISSASLSNDPLLYIDGVRVLERGPNLGTIYVGGGSPSFLNDLNPDEIESIEIVKGPSASTLYGTQAANGVIRVTTKKGKAGPAKWMASGEYGGVFDVTKYPAMYYSQGSDGGLCLPYRAAAGSCTITQLYDRSAFAVDSTTPVRDGHRYQMGVQVSGGTESSRYFVAAEIENVMGQIKMPTSELNYLKGVRGVDDIPENQKNPSTLKKASIRANVGGTLGSKADFNVSTGYVSSNNLIPQTGDNLEGVYASALYGTANPASPLPWGFARPAYGLSHSVYRISDHFTPSGTVNWRPLSWLSAHGTAGLDYIGFRDTELARNGEACPFCGNAQGIASDNRWTTWKYSVDVGANATYKITSQIGGKTAVGVQYNQDVGRVTYNTGQILPPGGETFTGAANKTSSEQTIEWRTFGTYIEQQISWKDKLYLTGAVRVDQNSAFGEQNRSATYPKVSASWVAIEHGQDATLSQIRLRAAYGQSGQQPGALAALTYYNPTTAAIYNQGTVPAVTIGGLGNTAVKPERSREIEAGFDISAFKSRVSAEFTYYDKQTSDALINRELPGSLGAVASQVQNVGVVSNKGVEVTVLGRALDKRSVTWDLSLTYAGNKNRLVSLAEGMPPLTGFGYRNAPGYPLFGLWWPRLTSFDDANGDGIISPSETVSSDTAEFNGSTVPTRTLGLNSSFGFFRNRLRWTAQLDYKGGYVTHNVNLMFQCFFLQNCQWLNDPSSSLENQAKSVSGAFGAFAEKADHVRLREMSLSYDLPAKWAHAIRAANTTVTLTGHNLWLYAPNINTWDPESNTAAGTSQDGPNYNFVQPGQTRSVTLRINLTF